jgi:hypothetical protein
MSDLPGGRWPQYNPLDRMLGQFSNATQGNIAARSNLYYTSLNLLTDQATAATKKGVFVPIPVEYGDVISKVSVLVGATEGKTGVESFVALYGGASKPKGKGLLLAQSKVAKAAIKPSLALTTELEKSVYISSTNAPFGYVWAGLTVEATTIETLVGFACKTGVQYEWFTGAPEAFAVELEQKGAGEAATEITIEGKATEKVPLVFLT